MRRESLIRSGNQTTECKTYRDTDAAMRHRFDPKTDSAPSRRHTLPHDSAGQRRLHVDEQPWRPSDAVSGLPLPESGTDSDCSRVGAPDGIKQSLPLSVDESCEDLLRVAENNRPPNNLCR